MPQQEHYEELDGETTVEPIRLPVRSHGSHGSAGGLAELSQSTVAPLIEMAREVPRDPRESLRRAVAEATLTPDASERCIYTLPKRGSEPIVGLSVWGARILARNWGNMLVDTHVVAIGEEWVTALGVAIDLENRLGRRATTVRRIMDKRGRRFNEDMIQMTCAAAEAIAFRRAVLDVVPQSYSSALFEAARRNVSGDATNIGVRRQRMFDRFAAKGVSAAEVLGYLGVSRIEDVEAKHIEVMVGVYNALDSGDVDVETVFRGGGAQEAVQRRMERRKALFEEGGGGAGADTSAG